MSSRDEELIGSSRARKRSLINSREAEEQEDRISSLSDELLHLIMSFMNTKFAVQTCVLSRRWKYLWKSLPYLDFDLKTFPFREKEKLLTSFYGFITQLLFRRHHTDLVKVRFCPRTETSQHVFISQGLIAYAVDHNVQQLNISPIFLLDFLMPESFYTCESLTALQVVNDLDGTILMPKFLALPALNLKSLHIHGCSLSKGTFNPGDFSTCPNLETLKLSRIYFTESDTLFVNAPKLKRFELSLPAIWPHWTLKVVVDAPELRTFHYHVDDDHVVCSFGDLASIDDVYFSMFCRYPMKMKMMIFLLLIIASMFLVASTL